MQEATESGFNATDTLISTLSKSVLGCFGISDSTNLSPIFIFDMSDSSKTTSVDEYFLRNFAMNSGSYAL